MADVAREDFENLHINLISSELLLEDLGRSVDHVGVWWVADRPPAFAPESSSVLEAVLASACRVLAAVELGPRRARDVLPLMGLPDWGEASVAAALRCEARALARRSPAVLDDGFNRYESQLGYAPPPRRRAAGGGANPPPPSGSGPAPAGRQGRRQGGNRGPAVGGPAKRFGWEAVAVALAMSGDELGRKLSPETLRRVLPNRDKTRLNRDKMTV